MKKTCKQSFASQYFDGKEKTLDDLKGRITPAFTDEETARQLEMLNVWEYAHSVLEVGCGIGRMGKAIIDLGHVDRYHGVDASAAMIEQAWKYMRAECVTLHHCDGNGSLPIIPQCDFVFAWLVFQHIANSQTVLRYATEMAYRTARDGWCVIQLLADDIRPENPLWTYHDPADVAMAMKSGGCLDVEPETVGRWIILRGCK